MNGASSMMTSSEHAGRAEQGELFEVPDTYATRGYRGVVASRIAGITYRQLDYWARKQIVEPSITPSHGSGSRRLYSFRDVVILAVSKRLLDTGVNLQNVTTAIGFLMQRTSDQLEGITIMCDGNEVHECTDGEQMVALLQDGKAVFGVSVGSLWHQIREALDDEEYVDLVDSHIASGAIDQIDMMHKRKRLASRRRVHSAA